MNARVERAASAEQMLPVRGSLSIEALRLPSYTVLSDGISLHLRGEIPRQEVAEMLDRITQVTRGRYYVPGSLAVSGDADAAVVASRFSVTSVTSRAGTAMLLLRAPANLQLVKDLFPLRGDTEVTLQLGIPQSLQPSRPVAAAPAGGPPRTEVQILLDELARARATTPQALLEQLTAFDGKRGRVPGKRSIAEVSEKQLPVLRDRLRRLRR